MRLWLDDLRKPPTHWVWAQTAQDAFEILVNCAVVEAHLDHDLGANIEGQDHENNGSWLCNKLEELAYHEKLNHLINCRFVIHSHNPDGVNQMWIALNRSFKYVEIIKFK